MDLLPLDASPEDFASLDTVQTESREDLTVLRGFAATPCASSVSVKRYVNVGVWTAMAWRSINGLLGEMLKVPMFMAVYVIDAVLQ